MIRHDIIYHIYPYSGQIFTSDITICLWQTLVIGWAARAEAKRLQPLGRRLGRQGQWIGRNENWVKETIEFRMKMKYGDVL